LQTPAHVWIGNRHIHLVQGLFGAVLV
jgi:hypothetical protein